MDTKAKMVDIIYQEDSDNVFTFSLEDIEEYETGNSHTQEFHTQEFHTQEFHTQEFHTQEFHTQEFHKFHNYWTYYNRVHGISCVIWIFVGYILCICCWSFLVRRKICIMNNRNSCCVYALRDDFLLFPHYMDSI